MYEPKYQEAIDEIKLKYPEYKDVYFEITDGELSYRYWRDSPKVDILLLQKEINLFLGQKKYRVIYTGAKTVYAIDEKQAKEFAERETFLIKPHISKVESYER